ncbi:hypothetical protein KEJ19_02060 [Candidatus Bathyarchaeota archaeon]|nr:hypothetical protein [Candidatus Bathyarchaeota archaeon]
MSILKEGFKSHRISLWLPRSHESIWRWFYSIASEAFHFIISEAFYTGRAKKVFVGERTINLNGVKAWIWNGWL